MTVSTEITTPPKSTKSRNSNYSVQIQIKIKLHLGIVLLDTEKSEFLDLIGFDGVAISEEIIVCGVSSMQNVDSTEFNTECIQNVDSIQNACRM